MNRFNNKLWGHFTGVLGEIGIEELLSNRGFIKTAETIERLFLKKPPLDKKALLRHMEKLVDSISRKEIKKNKKLQKQTEGLKKYLLRQKCLREQKNRLETIKILSRDKDIV